MAWRRNCRQLTVAVLVGWTLWKRGLMRWLVRLLAVAGLMEVLLTTCKTSDPSPVQLPVRTHLRDPEWFVPCLAHEPCSSSLGLRSIAYDQTKQTTVAWLFYVCDVTDSHVRYCTFIYVTWFVTWRTHVRTHKHTYVHIQLFYSLSSFTQPNRHTHSRT